MLKINVQTAPAYDIMIGAGFLDKAAELISSSINPKPERAAVISDSNVFPIYGKALVSSLKNAGIAVSVFVFNAGEESKNLATFGSILEFFAAEGLVRSDIAVALGGGVSGDIAGFASAVYQRGMRCVQIPTSLLAMVDSSVGGKTAVDLNGGKNLAGAFHQPSLVICDTGVLATLPAQNFAEGSAEAVKYGFVFEAGLARAIASGSLISSPEETIARCVEWKRFIVEKDEFDLGERKLLNFGHTVGHAVEKLSSYKISHGHAVSIGMAIMFRAAVHLFGLSETCACEAVSALEKMGLPVSVDHGADKLFEASLSDKKRRSGGNIDIVVPESFGKCAVKTVSLETLRKVIEAGI